MNRPHARIVLMLVSAICLTAPGQSRGAPRRNPEADMARLERRIAREREIHIETAALRVEMSNPRLSGGWLTSPGDSAAYALQDVREIMARRSYAGRGAGIGVMAGILVGAGFGAWASAMTEPSQRSGPSNDDSGQTMALAAVGAGVGLVVGALVGAAVSGWKPIYRQSSGEVGGRR